MRAGQQRMHLEAMRFDTGLAWLDLLATVGNAYSAHPVERLSTVRRFQTWLTREGLTPRQRPDEDDLAQAWRLRETLRSLVLAAVAGQRPPADAVRALNAVLGAEEPVQVRQVSTGLALAAPRTAAGALARLAREAAGDLGGAVLGELGRCADEDCGMFFHDPGGRRRWCAAQTCGVRHRVRAHRARQRDGAAADPLSGPGSR